ncbi:MAG: Rieske 2Fe-2S domain-containing protein, partial [Mycobacterium sp.]|nr:Rieske 2Fe-2S domain-containing protein [Mycobacterium sp.]
MLTQEQNDRLTRVGPGTPMGELMRRYWHPVATLVELDQEPVQAVKLLGENLALYRSEDGQLGLLAQRCPHRGASLAYGIPEEDGLRCCYHGWKFGPDGCCLEQPAEPEDSTFKDRIRIPAYPVQVMGGLVWAYLGPEPVPLLPRFEIFVNPDMDRDVGISRLPCNWLQVAENTVDPVHIEYLHMRYTNYVHGRKGKPPVPERHHERTAYDVFEYGIMKRRLWVGDSEDSDEWTTGHPQLLPGTAVVVAGEGWLQFQLRVPQDDTHTIIYWYNGRLRPPGVPPREEVSLWENPWQDAAGRFILDTLNGQDMLAMISQGDLSDRRTERLGTSDKGVILYRSLLEEQIERVQRGEDPLGTVRDKAKNEPWIDLPREKAIGFAFP